MNKFLDKEPGVRVGDTLRLEVLGKEIDWQVVGIAYLAVALTSAACYIPAHNAYQMTIRETLAYE